jgi:hypothetical protein
MTHSNFLRLPALLSLLLSPLTLFSQPSETMPTAIPDEIITDWKKQDSVTGNDYTAAISKMKSLLPVEYISKINSASSETDYLTACHWRRVAKLKPFMGNVKKVLYAKHYNMGNNSTPGSLSGLPYEYQAHWEVGSGLYILTMDNYYPKPEALLEDTTGIIKDPCPSFDGTKVVFAWWKAIDKKNESGFHIYEIDVATKKTRQITRDPLDLKIGDYEPCYLPTGDILFNSSRSYTMVNCSYNTVGNLYLCNKDGDWLRKIGFDQETSFTPVMMSTGEVLYSRWEFNDRTRISCGGYFTMNPDGTIQTEYWGNQSDFPLVKCQGREIPNSGGKIMGIAGDHFVPYQGEIIVIDPSISRNNIKGSENASIKLIAPVRKVPVDPSNASGGTSGIKYLFQNPWPFDTASCLVSWRARDIDKIFNIYFFNADASRELIAWDSTMSVSQPVVMDAHQVPPHRALNADYTKETGVFGMVDVYFGTGSKGVPAGKIKKLRVISIDYRTNYSQRCGLLGFSVNPIGTAYTSWLVKTLIGEIPVAEDGSACFIAPANTPLYFQTVDADGRMVNTMRSWTTLMPGERFDCVGCHENKLESSPIRTPIAVTPQPLQKPLGIEGQPMSFPKVIQPILDRHCTSCHNASHKSLDLRANPKFVSGANKTFNSSYTNLTNKQKKYVDWITQESKAAPITTFPAPGSGTSPLADMLLKGHNTDVNKITPREREILFVWMDMMVPHGGTFYEGMEAADSTKYVTYLVNNRNKHIEWEKTNMKAFVDAGQWNNTIYNEATAVDKNRYLDKLKAMTDASGQLQIIRVAGSLTVQCPGTGTISLLDITGRTLMKVTTTVAAKNGTSQAILPLKMPAGIYIVKFNGNGMAKQRIVTCLSPGGDRL